MWKRLFLRCALPALVTLLGLAGTAPATIIHVNPEGTGDYPAIQPAIFYAVDGDTILAAPGVYTGYFDKNLELRGKAITLMSSAGPESTVIDCQMDGRGFDVHEGEGPGTVIQGFTVTNGRGSNGGGMTCYGTSPTVRDMVFRQCAATGTSGNGVGGAVYCSDGSAATFTDIVMFDNEAISGGALFAWGSSSIALNGCSIVANSSSAGGSVHSYTSAIRLENTLVAYEHPGEGTTCGSYGVIHATHCLFFANAEGDDICGDDVENLWEYPYLCDWESGDLELCADSPCLPANNPYGVHIGARGEGDCTCPEDITVTVPFEYPTITEALDASDYGDTILVFPGVYYESNLEVGLGIALIGVAGPDSTTIDASGGGWGIRAGFQGRDRPRPDDGRIEGFTITGATDSAIKILYASPTITDCTITGNTALAGAGMHCSWASPVVTDVAFIGNQATTNSGGALYCLNSRPAFSDCVFWGNIAVEGGAAYCTNYSSARFTGCTFSDNAAATCGVLRAAGSSPVLEYCVIAHNAGEPVISCEISGNPTVTRCVVYRNDPNDQLCGSVSANIYAPPMMCDHAAGDLTVCEQSVCLPENNAFGVRVGAFGLGECSCPTGSTLTVPSEYPTMAGALAAAGVNDTILVGPGVYYERDLAIPWGARMIGVGGPDSTVIDAQGEGSVIRMVYSARRSGEDGVQALDGFTVTGGADSGIRIAGHSLAVRNCVISGNSATSGGGVSAEDGSVFLENCVISGNSAANGGGVTADHAAVSMESCEVTGNTAAGWGGGVWALESFVEITESTFSANTAVVQGGGIRASDSRVSVRESRFEGNSTYTFWGNDGGGVMGESSELFLESCEFVGNTAASGGGLYCEGGDSTIVTDCLFVGNEALYDDPLTGGGGVHCHSETLALISGSTFCGNAAPRGGGIYARGQASAAITGCTLVENDASYGSGAFVRNSALDIENTILAFGLGEGALYCADNAVTMTRYCDVYGNAGGDSLCGGHYLNLFADPAFCDTTGSLFYLQECSPCAAAGLGGENIGAWGVSCPCGDASGVDSDVSGLVLLGCSPNPSSSGFAVRYLAPRDGGRVVLDVYAVSGRRVATLARAAPAGGGVVHWNGCDSEGRPVGSGVYFYELSAGGESRRGRMVVLK